MEKLSFSEKLFKKYINEDEIMEIVKGLINNNKSVNYGFGTEKHTIIITNMIETPKDLSFSEFSDIVYEYLHTPNIKLKIHAIIEQKLKKHQKSGSYKKYDKQNGSIHEYNYFLPMFDQIYDEYFEGMKSYEEYLLSDSDSEYIKQYFENKKPHEECLLSDVNFENINEIKNIMALNKCDVKIAKEIFITNELLKFNNKKSPEYNSLIKSIFKKVKESLNYDTVSSFEKDSIDMYIPDIRTNILTAFRKQIQDRKNKIKI